MRHGKWLLIFMVVSFSMLLGACTVFAEPGKTPLSGGSVQFQKKQMEAPTRIHAVLSPHPGLIQGRLANGLRYVLLQNKKPENRISMHLDVQVGSMHESENERGLAHYLEHMVFNGSTHYDPGALVDYFQSIGMMFGPDANAHTGFYETVYDINLPANDGESINQALTVLLDYAQGALLLPEEIRRERGVVLAEKKDRDSVSYRTFRSALAFEMPGSRLARRLPIGTDAVLYRVNHGLLNSFYEAWYRPENMVVVMVGDFDPQVAETYVKARFETMTARAPLRHLPQDNWPSHQGIKAFYHHEPEAGSTEVAIQTVQKVPFVPDTLGAYKQRTVEELGNMMLQHRLSRALVRKEAPFSDAGAYTGTYFRDVHFTVVAAEADPEKWRASLIFLEKALRQALTYGFTPAELKRVKADTIQSLQSAVNAADSRESTWLAREIIRQINQKRIFQSPENELEILKPFVEGLSLETVNQRFRQAWDAGHRLIKVTGNARIKTAGNTLPEAVITACYRNSGNIAVAPWSQAAVVPFPYLPVPETPGKIIAENHLAPSGIVQIDFENQLQLNLLKTDYKANEFLFRVNFGPGRQSQPAHLPGLATITQSVVNESGLGRMDQETLDAALAGRDVTMEFGMDHGRFYFAGRAQQKEAELVFQLLQASFEDPGFRQNIFDLAVERYRQMYKELKRSPQGMMSLEGDSFLAGGDTRFGMPSLEAVNALTLADVRSWLGPWLAHGSLSLSIVGDISPDRMKHLAATYLGTLPDRRRSFTAEKDRLPVFPAGKSRTLKVDSRIDKGLVQLAFKTDDFWDIHATRRLNILAQVFSERLRKTIREKLGVTYSPQAYNDPSQAYEGYGVMHAVATTAPEMTGQVIRAMAEIADELFEKGVTEKELSLVLPPVLTHIRDLKENNRYWLNSVLSGCRQHPEQLRWSEEIYTDYAAITAPELSRLARKFLGPDNRARVIIVAQ